MLLLRLLLYSSSGGLKVPPLVKLLLLPRLALTSLRKIIPAADDALANRRMPPPIARMVSRERMIYVDIKETRNRWQAEPQELMTV